ncbi:MAG: bifunctional 3,4-dihydroxy-2-butanone-4-phosphate synthase/GTP cyclohydrolase II [Candidatus Margulisbacteria bacterium]|nr:bifunctional 3,4-dihydroxy-2-butanone-4-phosphate synthase/GTP cyclohydrolase II [Candidatus Margulisiibacteriota bacterium]MBU1616896.1 bifunctional 3,4-dihydroxy-2-butanone-4-phosphate synthase/GTP cyclohydrolase II [Candidatus Margulisiibacteriota bacterium]MBU1867206.1 bifunctional 3,4-dihydroxy-2-butanone-4-phosphate synthase/GTP cyclohydrolase II [Candidatus Margulisiibacteriota bacterium]
MNVKSKIKFNTIAEAIEDIRNGKLVVVVDDADRENEGDLVVAAEKITPELVNFMITHAKGLVCVPMTGDRADELELDQMVGNNREKLRTAFTVSVDAHHRFGVSTGISPSDRAKTIEVLINPRSKVNDLVKPGHIFPLRAVEGGVLRRAGHTEASVDLAKMAGLYPAAVICEIIHQDGSMARVPQLMEFARWHKLKIVTVADLISYRMNHEKLVRRISTVKLPTKHGEFSAVGYENILNGESHIALVKGKVKGKKDVLVRVHSECLTGDAFGSLRCDCGEQLAKALEKIEFCGLGVLLYMRQEGRGIGLKDKLRAYELQEQGYDTVEANEMLGFAPDLRDYGIGAQILCDLGLTSIKLLTNNPKKVVGLAGYGLKITQRLPLEVGSNKFNEKYLRTKSRKLGHLLEGVVKHGKSDRRKSGSK